MLALFCAALLFDIARADKLGTELNAACALGIVKGVGGGRLDPNGGATRAQTAVMISRMLDIAV